MIKIFSEEKKWFCLLFVLLCGVIQVAGQNEKKEVKGVIKDRAGIFLPDISVGVKGADIGTVSDIKGAFQLLAGQFDSLEFSGVGYITQTIAVGKSNVFNITMEAGRNTMNEVVVVGFGKQRKISVVGAQSTVKTEELRLPAANVSTMLAGRVSGVIGVQRTGQPGKSMADIWIRGIATFGGGSSSPLVLYDGVERPINDIDPEDIASFTILKDAAGTAVYGVRGANGVILITGKTGKIGKPVIKLDYSHGLEMFTQKPKMADAKTYMEAANESLTTRGQKAKYSNDYIEKTLAGSDPELYPTVDWFDAIYRSHGVVKRANLNVNGGSDFLKYYGSVGYFDETGLLKTAALDKYNTDFRYKRFTVTTNMNMNLSKTTKLDIGIRGMFVTNNASYLPTNDMFGSVMSTPPTEFPLEYTGGYIPGKNPNGSYRNPWADLTRRGYRTEYTNQIFSNLRLTQDFGFLVRGLTGSAMVAYDAKNWQLIARTKREDTFFPDLNNPRNADGSLNLLRTFVGTGNFLTFWRENSGDRKLYSEGSLNYDNSFGRHRVGGMALFYSEDYTNQFAGNYTYSIPERYIGLAGRVTYSYDDRYFLEGNLGYNGSELFAPKNRYGLFPAFGIGWVPSNEKFWQPISNVISYFKLRYSDGQTGIGKIPGRRFAYLDLVDDNMEGYQFGSNLNYISGINVSEYGTSVKWATSRKRNLGVELRAIKDQLSIVVDLFKERRTGIFLQRTSIPYFVGLAKQPYDNLGIVDNKGIDGTMEFNTQIGSVKLGLRGNFTYNKDVVIENDQPTPMYPWMEQRGHNILARFGYIAEGLFKDQAEIDQSAVPGDKSKVMPGDIKYKDLNGDGIINSYDMTLIGRGDIPRLIYGFGFNLGYKDFNMSALFTGQEGADLIIGGDAIYPFANGAGISNVYSNITDRWTESNPRQDVFYPRLANGEDRNQNNIQRSTWWLKKANVLRLKTVELSYNVPKRITGKYLRGATVYFQTINPLSWSSFDLWDTESTQWVQPNGASYPNIKTYSLGISLTF